MNPSIDVERLARVQRIFDAAQADFPTRSEVASTIAEVVKALQLLSSTLKDLLEKGDEGAVKKALAAFSSSSELKALQAGLSKDVPQQISVLAKQLASVPRETDAKLAPVSKRVASLEKQQLDSRVSALEAEEDAEPTPEETPESIRNKLESLKGTPSALAIDAIFGLERRLDEIEKEARVKGSGGSVIAYSRGAIKLYDLSDQLDGSKTSFSLPNFWRVISVQSTSSPTVFRPTTDYTTDANLSTITFTNQITAAATLAAGQTLTVIYAEP